MMAATLEARTISVSIGRDWREVYAFAHRPENFPRWASGAAKSLHKEGDDWVAEAPEGRVKVRFAERNDFGVLDHWVMPEPGVEIYIPLRVVANGTGCEVIFTLFRLPEMTDETFARDAESVTKDLNALKTLLESRSTRKGEA
ncbi:MAG: SRPBCC family protein [Geminicoccaceae bacterium]